MYDIIPDIHGQSGKLERALTALGYAMKNGAWRHGDPGRRCLFLGDFIDRGPDNAGVIAVVRAMIDAGSAIAVMGNHELNAIHFHTAHPETGEPLRVRSDKNIRQHKSFLDEFPPGAPATAEVIGWMRTLPLWIEFRDFRAVHACWDEGSIERLGEVADEGVLSEADLIRVADAADPLHDLVETVTKGPEITLPPGYALTDKDGTVRREVRVKWWNAQGRSWADIAMSVPDPGDLPTGQLPESVTSMVYPADAKPVFFGHYWLVGKPVLQAPNALCLDYSAGRDGPLLSYTMEGGQRLALENIVDHGR